MFRMIAILSILTLCLGQGCPSAGTIPANLNSPIPEGIYSGYPTAISKMKVNITVLIQTTESYTTSVAFGPDGLLLTETNQPMYIGYSDTMSIGGTQMALTITSVTTVNNGVKVVYDLTAMTADGFTMTGYGDETYVLQPDGSIFFLGGMILGVTVPPDYVSIIIDSMGTLYK